MSIASTHKTILEILVREQPSVRGSNPPVEMTSAEIFKAIPLDEQGQIRGVDEVGKILNYLRDRKGWVTNGTSVYGPQNKAVFTWLPTAKGIGALGGFDNESSDTQEFIQDMAETITPCPDCMPIASYNLDPNRNALEKALIVIVNAFNIMEKNEERYEAELESIKAGLEKKQLTDVQEKRRILEAMISSDFLNQEWKSHLADILLIT